MFFVYATYYNGGSRVGCSDEFSLGEQLEGLPLILGLLTDWVRQSLSNFGKSLISHSGWMTLLDTIKIYLHSNENCDCDSCSVLFVFFLGHMVAKDFVDIKNYLLWTSEVIRVASFREARGSLCFMCLLRQLG